MAIAGLEECLISVVQVVDWIRILIILLDFQKNQSLGKVAVFISFVNSQSFSEKGNRLIV